jgi:predicted HicB family RNase H-like nuclease
VEGKFQVRIPPERHKALAMQAAEQGISLSRYVMDKPCV